MTGLERNGDVVRMASYAPLLAHKDAWQWVPDAIWFDNLHSYGTPNYQVQRLYGTNSGNRTLPATPQATDTVYTSAVVDDRSHSLVLKVVSNSAAARKATIHLDGLIMSGMAKVTTLASADLQAENTFEHPNTIVPVETSLAVTGGTIEVTLPAYSVTVYRVPMP